MKHSVDFQARVEYDDEYLLLWPLPEGHDRICFFADDLVNAAGWLPDNASKVHVFLSREDGQYSLTMFPLEETSAESG